MLLSWESDTFIMSSAEFPAEFPDKRSYTIASVSDIFPALTRSVFCLFSSSSSPVFSLAFRISSTWNLRRSIFLSRSPGSPESALSFARTSRYCSSSLAYSSFTDRRLSPANESRSSIWHSVLRSDWLSCCPCISISLSPIAFINVAETIFPFILQVFFPDCEISLDNISVPSSSGSIPISFIISLILSASTRNTASTRAFSEPVRMISLDTLSPRTALMESIIIDLPAPVSPVSTLRPSPSSMLISSISATSWISSCRSILAEFTPNLTPGVSSPRSFPNMPGPAHYTEINLLNLLTSSSAIFSARHTIIMVSSPAIEPTISGHFIASTADAAAWAIPGSVFTTTMLFA